MIMILVLVLPFGNDDDDDDDDAFRRLVFLRFGLVAVGSVMTVAFQKPKIIEFEQYSTLNLNL